MQENKKWYLSKTVIGGIVAGIAGIAGLFNFTLDTEAQTGITELIIGMSTLFGSALAVYGRVKATKGIEGGNAK